MHIPFAGRIPELVGDLADREIGLSFTQVDKTDVIITIGRRKPSGTAAGLAGEEQADVMLPLRFPQKFLYFFFHFLFGE